MTGPRHLGKEAKASIEPFENLLYKMWEAAQEMTDEQISKAIITFGLLSQTNCSWAAYQVRHVALELLGMAQSDREVARNKA